jgi:hypothetical protein
MSQPYLSFVPAGASSQPQDAQTLVESVDEEIAAVSHLLEVIRQRQPDIVKICSDIEDLLQGLMFSLKTLPV